MLLHEELKLANLQSFWCGGREFQSRLREEKDDWMITPAFSSNLVFEKDDRLLAGIDHSMVVAQERLSLSTTPVYRHQRLLAAPMTLRMFLVRTSNGWEAMPGGFARIGSNDQADSISLQKEERFQMSG